jgi:general secretion pathway protein H
MSGADRQRGFTLIELLAVMLIIALMASLAVSWLPRTGRARLEAVALEAAALLRRERTYAILSGREHEVVLDGERRALVADSGGAVAIPRDVSLDILGADERRFGRRLVASFHSDGASSGAVLKLSQEKASYEVKVNWYTGGVTVVSP